MQQIYLFMISLDFYELRTNTIRKKAFSYKKNIALKVDLHIKRSTELKLPNI